MVMQCSAAAAKLSIPIGLGSFVACGHLT